MAFMGAEHQVLKTLASFYDKYSNQISNLGSLISQKKNLT